MPHRLAPIDATHATLEEIECAIDAALDHAVQCGESDLLAAAQRLAEESPAFADAILACALGRGLRAMRGGDLAPDSLAFGRWTVLAPLGAGATATAVRARDELLSRPEAPVEVVIKRFDDEIGGDARLHALREMRALLCVPAGLAPRLVALHAPPGEAAHLIMQFEESRPPECAEDFLAALDALRLLHERGFAHGDLKRDHIRIRRDGTAFFIDFGCAVRGNCTAMAEDRRRCATMARAGIEGLVARLPLRVALALRSRRPMRGLLRRRRAAISATVAGAVLGAAAIATIDRPTLPDRRFADSGRMLGSLARPAGCSAPNSTPMDGSSASSCCFPNSGPSGSKVPWPRTPSCSTRPAPFCFSTQNPRNRCHSEPPPVSCDRRDPLPREDGACDGPQHDRWCPEPG